MAEVATLKAHSNNSPHTGKSQRFKNKAKQHMNKLMMMMITNHEVGFVSRKIFQLL